MDENVPRRMKRFSRGDENENIQPQRQAPPTAINEKKQEQIKNIFKTIGKNGETAKEKKPLFGIKLFGGKPKAEEKKIEIKKETAPQKRETARQDKGKEQDVSEALFDQLRDQKKRETKKESINLAVTEIKRFKEEHNRYPSGGEYDEIAENIYQQIKQAEGREEAQAQRQRTRRQAQAPRIEEKKIDNPFEKQPVQKTETIESQLKGRDLEKLDKLDVKDLFGEEEKEIKLENIASESEDELKLEELDEGIDSISKEFETEKNSCPNCKAKTNELVFCPECGTAFCTHCAKAAKTEAGITKYVCPKCNKEVKSQK